jgi:hypothetical protein
MTEIRNDLHTIINNIGLYVSSIKNAFANLESRLPLKKWDQNACINPEEVFSSSFDF